MSKSKSKKEVHLNPDAESSSSSSSSSLLDFLGRPPSNLPSEESSYHTTDEESGEVQEVTGEEDDSGENNDDADEPNENDDSSTAENRKSGESAASGDKSSESSGRHSTRKQVRPIKRKNNLQKEIKKLQNSTNLLIPRLPFQRYIKQTKNNLFQTFNLNNIL